MREILFRGKRLYDGEWVYGSFIPDAMEFRDLTIEMPGFICSYDFEHDSGYKVLMHEVDRESVGQFTGATDKNGKKIFEGDTVRVNRSEVPSIVEYSECNCGFHADSRSDDYFSISVLNRDLVDLEVIGNIYDNPELLEAQS